MTKVQNIYVGLLLTGTAGLAGWWTHNILFGWLAVLAWGVTLLCPVLYTPVSLCWYGLASRLERLFSVFVLGILFFLVITPVGCFRRRTGKDGGFLSRFGKGTESVFTVCDHTYRPEDLEHPY